MHWDLVIQNGKVFDGSGAPGKLLDVAIKDGRVAALGRDLPESAAQATIDASGKWVTPGLLDIHTHEDLEVELDPGLPEIVRHGTTTAVVGNCSIGLAFGAQRRDGADPIVDCFARVENIPKPVLRRAAQMAVWNNPADYYDHLDALPMSANLAAFVPHSMLRIEVMGFNDSISRDPTDGEITRMAGILNEALQDGFLGMSIDGLPLHFLANAPNVEKRIPTQYAGYEEYKRLAEVVRRHGRVWQMTPATDDGALTLKLMALTSGRLHGKPMKITALAALESVNNRMTRWQALAMSRLFNSSAMNGHFRMQSLAAPFKIFSEGVVSPLAEANPLLRRLIETELDDREGRVAILEDAEFVESFREMWSRGKAGWNIGHLRRKLRLEREFLTRDLRDMIIYRAPVDGWEGQSMAELFVSYQGWRLDANNWSHAGEADAFARIGTAIRDDGEFFLALLRVFDRDIYWHYITANRDPRMIRELLLHPLLLPGFNDSGAHVTNMAFYDGNLRALGIGARESEDLFAHMLKRLTSEPADFFGLDAGRLEVGSRADITTLNPAALKSYDGDASIEYIYRDLYNCHQLVNRSDGVVDSVVVGGQQVWGNGAFTEAHGQVSLGNALRAH